MRLCGRDSQQRCGRRRGGGRGGERGGGLAGGRGGAGKAEHGLHAEGAGLGGEELLEHPPDEREERRLVGEHDDALVGRHVDVEAVRRRGHVEEGHGEALRLGGGAAEGLVHQPRQPREVDRPAVDVDVLPVPRAPAGALAGAGDEALDLEGRRDGALALALARGGQARRGERLQLGDLLRAEDGGDRRAHAAAAAAPALGL